MAIMNASRKFIGVETGFSHLAIAVGCFSVILVPSFGYTGFDEHNGFLFKNICYENWMWKRENKRVEYILKDDYMSVLNYL